jgi:hypothetical protein
LLVIYLKSRLSAVRRHTSLTWTAEGLIAVVRYAIGLPAVLTPVDMRSTQANRSIHGRSSDRRLIGNSTPDDGASHEGRRREPPPIVLVIAATILARSSMSIVVAPVTTAFEPRALKSAFLTRTVKAAALKSVPIIITPKLHLLQADACCVRLHER